MYVSDILLQKTITTSKITYSNLLFFWPSFIAMGMNICYTFLYYMKPSKSNNSHSLDLDLDFTSKSCNEWLPDWEVVDR